MADATKKWYLSKTVWAGVVAVLVAGYNAAAAQFGLPAIPEFVFAILGAFGVYGRATATTSLK
jgi:hypothetical protein